MPAEAAEPVEMPAEPAEPVEPVEDKNEDESEDRSEDESEDEDEDESKAQDESEDFAVFCFETESRGVRLALALGLPWARLAITEAEERVSRNGAGGPPGAVVSQRRDWAVDRRTSALVTRRARAPK